MKPKLNALVIGAGGVASYMLPALNNSFDLSGYLIDGDILEKHNLDRQIFGAKDIGKFKAPSLLKHHKITGMEPINEYIEMDFPFKHTEALQDDTALVICLVDNHPARRAALNIAREYHIPIIICANEYATSQVLYWHPDTDENFAPDIRYPEIATSDKGSPINCTGEVLESTPQLAIANQVSAALGNMMLWQWHGTEGHIENSPDEDEVQAPDWAPVEFQTTFSKIESITLHDLKNG